MSDKRRIDAPDTIDFAIHYLLKLQSEGWGLAELEHEIDYGKPGKKTVHVPVGAVLKIRLIPGA